MDAHGLLLELEEELDLLCGADFTHCGIGFAFDKHQVKVVEFLTTKTVMVNQLNQSEDGGVEIRGVVLNKKVGLYAARIASLAKLDKKEQYKAGPQNIQFNKSTGNFILTFPGPINDGFYFYEDLRVLQLYIREAQIDKIQYGVVDDRIVFSHLKLALTLPMEFIPDPRIVQEDAHDMEREAKDRELRLKRQQEEALIKQAERLARQAERDKQKNNLGEKEGESEEDSGSGSKAGSRAKSGSQRDSKDQSGEEEEEKSESEEEDEESDDSEGLEDLPTQNQMKKDLIQAIEEELREADSLRKENEEL